MIRSTFLALLWRDARVARRGIVTLLLQTLFQPMLFVFVFGRVMTTSGFMPAAYKAVLLPGIIATSMLFSGIQAVTMPLIAEFQWTREIEDRLLAPIEIEWLAVEKVLAGALNALLAGLVVIPLAWLVMDGHVGLSSEHVPLFLGIAVLVAISAATLGLAVGCTVSQSQIGLMFSLLVVPMVFFGCTYYPWHALESFPIIKYAVLINPTVYAAEGFRSALAPQFRHMPEPAIVIALLLFDAILFVVGVRQFRRKAIG